MATGDFRTARRAMAWRSDLRATGGGRFRRVLFAILMVSRF